MSSIEIVKVGEHRYAPEEANEIRTFTFNGASDLSIGQLIMAVCINRSAALERITVSESNKLAQTSGFLDAAGQAVELLMEDYTTNLDNVRLDLTATTYTPQKCGMNPTLREFFEIELGASLSSVSEPLQINDKLSIFNQIKSQIESATRMSKTQAIDLQSYVNRRDVTYNMSATITGTFLSDFLDMADKF